MPIAEGLSLITEQFTTFENGVAQEAISQLVKNKNKNKFIDNLIQINCQFSASKISK